jgi:putative hydrolase of the HAD superfamily
MSQEIKAIIFDLGNVVVDFDHRIAARRISKFTPKTPEEIFNLFFDSELTALFEEGRISPQDFFSGVKEILNLGLSYEEFLPIWNEIFFLSDKNHAVYGLAKTLKKKYKISMLSNVNILHFEYLKRNFNVFDAFTHIITSYEAGVKKPDPLIYKKTLEAMEVLPSEAFYTDDRSELVQSAKELGIRGFVFKGVEQLRADLCGAGVDCE